MRRLAWFVLTALLVAGCGRQATPVVSTVPPLQLRLVSSSSERPCHASPLVSAGAGTACSWDGSSTYSLGPSLADLHGTGARFFDSVGMTSLDVDLDHDSAAVLARVTGDQVGKQVAVLFRGRVVTAPVIQSRIDGGGLQLTGDTSALQQVGRALHATTSSP